MAEIGELAEQLVGIERWASDLDVRAHRLLSSLHTPAQVHTLADEYAALAEEREAVAASCELTRPPQHETRAERLRRLSTTDRERSAYYRQRASDALLGTERELCADAFVPPQRETPR